MLSMLMAFGLGYALGTQAGEGGLEEIKEAALDIASSPQVQDLLATGANLASEVAGGGLGDRSSELSTGS